MHLYLATNNLHKKKEIQEVLSEHTILIPSDCGIPFSHEETGSTYLENALGKAFCLYQKIKQPVLADDSGLSCAALDGAPGIYSARFGSTKPEQVLSDTERNQYLLQLLTGNPERKAYYVCCMVLVTGLYEVYTAQDTLHGIIVDTPAGTGGFGYDPIFFLPEYQKCVAELPAEEKNRISHRGKALKHLQMLLKTLTD